MGRFSTVSPYLIRIGSAGIRIGSAGKGGALESRLKIMGSAAEICEHVRTAGRAWPSLSRFVGVIVTFFAHRGVLRV